MAAGERPPVDVAAGWDALDDLIANGVNRAAPPASHAEALAEAFTPAGARPWRASARDTQLRVADSTTPFTFYCAGRGTGKTYTAANTFAEWAMTEPGYYAIVAPTFGDCRALCVEGPSGILRALGAPNGEPGGDLLFYNRSKNELTLTNGSVIVMASDEAPGRLRGPNFTGAWCDEIASWRRVKETWEEGIMFSVRVGSARKLMTGTPKRGHPMVVEFHDRGMRGDPDVTLVRDSTWANRANLSPEALRTLEAKYLGTVLGKQELEGQLLADAEGAIVTSELIDATRVAPDCVPALRRVMIGVDPAVTSRETSDFTGIIVIGLGPAPLRGYTGDGAAVEGDHLYILADESLRATPRAWAERVLKTAEQWAADAITAEVNQGGDLVSTMLRLVAESDGYTLPRIRPVRAAVGKRTRAEPVAGVWEQKRIHVVGGLRDVEDQWAGWVPGSDEDSPDQLDASVWGAVGLMPELAVNASPKVTIITSGGTGSTYQP